MAGVCSKHQHCEPNCKLCNTQPGDMLRHDGSKMFPDWDEQVAKAEASGEVECVECEFVYYRIAGSCPLCGQTTIPAEEKETT